MITFGKIEKAPEHSLSEKILYTARPAGLWQPPISRHPHRGSARSSPGPRRLLQQPVPPLPCGPGHPCPPGTVPPKRPHCDHGQCPSQAGLPSAFELLGKLGLTPWHRTQQPGRAQGSGAGRRDPLGGEASAKRGKEEAAANPEPQPVTATPEHPPHTVPTGYHRSQAAGRTMAAAPPEAAPGAAAERREETSRLSSAAAGRLEPQHPGSSRHQARQTEPGPSHGPNSARPPHRSAPRGRAGPGRTRSPPRVRPRGGASGGPAPARRAAGRSACPAGGEEPRAASSASG
ncbi:translation initiation factor IF-2-like [Apus apus]|uniref:translation initiation factor IF-2-like n=1 Tax=Apus apus TaxID=8895 RepID=UPI0021F908BF|nr:translation initiation factor IF-2-like [Apus apus]